MQFQSASNQENMTKFLNTQVKITNKDDLRLDALIKEGKQGQIVIVGCPFDYVRKRAINKGGEENGPCCIRRFYHKIGPLYNSEYQINISDLKVSDYGNIQPTQQQLKTPQRVINKITDEISIILNNKSFPFVFGGSKETSLASARSFHQLYSSGQHLVIAGMPFLKRPFDNDKLTSQNLMTILEQQFPGKNILFGPHQNYFPKSWNKNIKNISYKQVYEGKYDKQQWKLGFSTVPVKKLSNTLEKDRPYHVTLSVEAIERFSGCRDLPTVGIKAEQMSEIFLWLGQQRNIKSIDITEFNPSCEDYESSLILLNLFYYFLMGWTRRQCA